LVIGDLGHAKTLDNASANASNSNRTFGTNNYLAPEADEPSKRTFKMDIWYQKRVDYHNTFIYI
jgi:hypothetical protein